MLIAIIDAHPSISQMLMFSAMGFGVVMAVLTVLSLATSWVGVFFRSSAKAKALAAQVPTVQKVKNISEIQNPEHAFVVSAAVAAVLPELEAEGGELIAVLAAAASVALGDECRIVSARLVPDMSYAYQGRQQIFASKNIIPVRSK